MFQGLFIQAGVRMQKKGLRSIINREQIYLLRRVSGVDR